MARSVFLDQTFFFRVASEDLLALKLRAQQERCAPSEFVRQTVLERLRDDRDGRRPGVRRQRTG